MSVADGLLLSLWTLWLLVALGLQSKFFVFRKAAAALPERIRSQPGIQALPVFSKKPPGQVRFHPANQAQPGTAAIAGSAANRAISNLIFVFVALAPVFMFGAGITWRSYLMAWLIIHVLVTSVTVVRARAAALALSTTSLVGLLWLWIQGGGAYSQYAVGLELPALVGLVLVAVTYGLILVPPEIRRRAAGRQEAEHKLNKALEATEKLTEDQRTLADNVASLLAGNNNTLREEMAELRREIEAGLRREIEANLRLVIDAVRLEIAALRQEAEPNEGRGPEPPAEGGLGDDAKASYYVSGSASDLHAALAPFRAGKAEAGLVYMCWFELPGQPAASAWPPKAYADSARPDGAPRPHFVERTVLTIPADAPASVRERLWDAFDNYEAEIITKHVYDTLTDRWIVRDPGGFAAAADAVAGAQDQLHRLLLGQPAEMICGTVAPAPVDIVAGGIIGALRLPIDRPLRDARLGLELTGLVVSLVLPLPVLHIACVKALGHDVFEKGAAELINAIRHKGAAELIKAARHDLAVVASEPTSAVSSTTGPAPGAKTSMPAAAWLEGGPPTPNGPVHPRAPTEPPATPTRKRSPTDGLTGGFSVGGP